MGFPKIRDTFLGGPCNKDYSILGSILRSPYLWKPPGFLIHSLKGQNSGVIGGTRTATTVWRMSHSYVCTDTHLDMFAYFPMYPYIFQ